MGYVTRRTVLYYSLTAPFVVLTAAAYDDMSFQLPAHDEEWLFQILAQKHWLDHLVDIARNPGKELIYHFSDQNGAPRHVAFSYIRNRFGFLIPRIRRDDGSVATLRFAHAHLRAPSIQFADERGNPLIRDNKKLEFPFDLEKGDFIRAGIAIIFGAFVIWIGAHVAKVLLAFLAVVAFYAMIIGVIIVGIAAAIYLGGALSLQIKRLDAAGLKESFEQKRKELEQYLRGLIIEHKG